MQPIGIFEDTKNNASELEAKRSIFDYYQTKNSIDKPVEITDEDSCLEMRILTHDSASVHLTLSDNDDNNMCNNSTLQLTDDSHKVNSPAWSPFRKNIATQIEQAANDSPLRRRKTAHHISKLREHCELSMSLLEPIKQTATSQTIENESSLPQIRSSTQAPAIFLEDNQNTAMFSFHKPSIKDSRVQSGLFIEV